MAANISAQRRLYTTSGLLIGAVLLFAVNIFASTFFHSARVDLTEGNLYTLADGTRSVLSKIQEPVTLRFYVSKKQLAGLPGVNSYAVRVEEMLKELERAADGKLRLLILDPEPFSEEEDRAVAYGLQGVPLDDTGATTFYFGLVGSNALDKEEVIPFFNPDRAEYLEYDLAKLIHQLSTNKEPVIGLISTIPLEGPPTERFFQPGMGEPLVIYEQMQQLFDVRNLETTVDRIPEDVNVLMLVHPKELTDKTLYAIDQFVLGGGRALVFVDPYAESAEPSNPMMGGQPPAASDLNKLLQSWGVELVPGVVAGDLAAAKKVQFSSGMRPVVVDYPVWMDVRSEQMATDDVITARLDRVTLATAGVLEKRQDATSTFQPLLRTTSKAAKISTARLGIFADPQDLLRGFRPEGEFVLAARVTGTVKSAFPDGAPKTEEADPADETPPKESETPPASEHLAQSKDSINIIVVADTDMLQDRFWVQVQNFLGQRIAVPSAANGSFVISALDNLLGSNDLISVRNRSGFARPFTVLRELQQEAEQQFLDKEKQLRDQLRDTEQKLSELQQSRGGGEDALILSAEQEAELQRFRDERLRIRKELRDVQHELRKSIESMEDWMQFLNIGLMPILVGVTGLAVGMYRVRRKRAAATAPKIEGASA